MRHLQRRSTWINAQGELAGSGAAMKAAGPRLRVGIVGAGQHGMVVWDILVAAGHEVVGFVDDSPDLGATEASRFRPLTRVDVVATPEALPPHDGVIVAIGDNRARARRFEELRAAGHRFVNAIHPSAAISQTTRLGVGVVVGACSVLDFDTEIGDNVIVNHRSVVAHGTRIRSHAHVAIAIVGAGCEIGEGVFLGLGSVVNSRVSVGDWAFCRMAARVFADVDPAAKEQGPTGRKA